MLVTTHCLAVTCWNAAHCTDSRLHGQAQGAGETLGRKYSCQGLFSPFYSLFYVSNTFVILPRHSTLAIVVRKCGLCYVTHRLWGAGEAELVAHAAVGVVGVPLDEVGHRVLGAPAVHDLGARVVRVHDVGPSNVTEISTLLQFFNWLANLGKCIDE